MLINYEYNGIFSVNDTCNFKKGHKYSFIIRDADDGHGFVVDSNYDLTERKEINERIYLSSEKSLERYFKIEGDLNGTES